MGERHFRPHRGLISRPTVKEVYEYRKYVDEQMLEFFEKSDDDKFQSIAVVIDIGLHHEQQHQELMVTDIKNVFSVNPLNPLFVERPDHKGIELPAMEWLEFEGEVHEIGHNGEGFFYDNEQPRHKTYLNDFKLASRLVTNREYIEFIEDGGYTTNPLWLSDGIATVETEGWQAPLYWQKKDGEWWYFTLNGFKKVNPNEPVCHVSFYEAEAYARWADARLATEAEWETAAQGLEWEGNFVESGQYHPKPLGEYEKGKLHQMFGDVWEWTRSDYAPYPGYRVPEGAIGEYNGKFMSNQLVLKGGSCATSGTHIRDTYRNFFYPPSRWQFMGIRLAKDK